MRYSRPHDGDDAHDDELQAYSRCPLCLPPEMAIFNHLLERQTRSWFWPCVPVLSAVIPVLSYWPLGGSPLSPLSPLYGRGFWIYGRDTRVFSRVNGLSPRRCCGFVVTAVTNAVHAGLLLIMANFYTLSQDVGASLSVPLGEVQGL